MSYSVHVLFFVVLVVLVLSLLNLRDLCRTFSLSYVFMLLFGHLGPAEQAENTTLTYRLIKFECETHIDSALSLVCSSPALGETSASLAAKFSK